MKKITFLFAAAAVALAAPAVAFAVEPTRQTVSFTTVAPRPCPKRCNADRHLQRDTRRHDLLRREGAPVRELTVISFEATTINPLTGQSLAGSGIRIFHRDLVTGEFFTTGNNVVTKLPDGGVAVGGAGRLVFDALGGV